MTDSNSGNSIDLGGALVGVGAIIATIATFLPWQESSSFRGIEHNTLIQHGGWTVIAVSLASAVSAYQVASGRSSKWWASLIWIGVAAVLLLIDASGSRTLYPVKDDGTVDDSGSGVTASLGIAIYVAWLGLGVMAVGTRFLYDSVRRRKAAEAS